jgi:hypothetical protein
MKTFVTLALCSGLFLVAGDASAQHHGATSARLVRCKHKSARHRVSNTHLLAEHCDEVVLSPNLMRELQRRLVDAGYLYGTVDGRLTMRTRRALAEFQRDYHMAGTGALDRWTAEALLGHERLEGFLVAKN